MSLQAILFLVIAGASGFAFIQGSFVTNQVHDQLVAQQIYFPTSDQIKPGGALDPAEFPQEIRDQAGNQVTDGNQARIYANDFIGIHLGKVANGLTYSQVSSKAIALQGQIANTPKTDPNYASMQTQLATLNGQKATLFQGEMLKATLLNSYGWWQFGVYMTYAAFGLAVVALGVLGALVFEVFIAARKPETVKVAQKQTATA
jgi:hypothetical protein